MNTYRLQSIIAYSPLYLLEYFKAESQQTRSVWLDFLLHQFFAGVSSITFLAPDMRCYIPIHHHR